jgi:hypothetical protein
MISKILGFSKYLTFSLLLGFIGGEVFLHIVRGESFTRTQYPLVYTPDTTVGYRGIPNKKGYIRKPSIDKRFALNNHGFFGPDFYPARPDSIYRIMIFGSSAVEGIWGDNKESFPATVNRLFKENGYKVEVINCGLSGGFRDLSNIALMKEMVPAYNPQLVLLASPIPISNLRCFRDIYQDYSVTFTGEDQAERDHSLQITHAKVDLVKQHRLITDLYDLSYLFRLWVRSHPDECATPAHTLLVYAKNCCDNWQYYSSFHNFNEDQSLDLLDSLRSQLDHSHARLVLFEFGSSDLAESFRNLRGNDSYISLNLPLYKKEYCLAHDGHPNAAGYNLIAEGMYKKLREAYVPARFFPKQKPSQGKPDHGIAKTDW